ncbi:MAG: DUF302 domain-containing protein [Gammaproteobacteria bacterium]
MRGLVCGFLMILYGASPVTASDGIFVQQIKGEFGAVYSRVHPALEEARFFVIFEADIGHNLARNADRWGEDYNRNAYEGVRSLVICNPWYANQLLNLDPELMALCPMSVTLLYKGGVVTVLFERLGVVAPGSPAADVLWEVENTIITAIESAATPDPVSGPPGVGIER